MAYNLLTGRRTGRDLSLCISGEDDNSGSWWNPFSSSAPSKDEEAVNEAKKTEKEAEKKVKRAKTQLELNQEARNLEAKAKAAQEKADKYKDDNSGIGLVYDSLGRAQIVDLPRR